MALEILPAERKAWSSDDRQIYTDEKKVHEICGCGNDSDARYGSGGTCLCHDYFRNTAAEGRRRETARQCQSADSRLQGRPGRYRERNRRAGRGNGKSFDRY